MEDFSIYNIPCDSPVDWHSIQPTFFHRDTPDNTWVYEADDASAAGSAKDSNYENMR